MGDTALRQLREERLTAQKRMAELVARTDERTTDGKAVLMSAEDRASFDAAEARISELNADIERRQRLLEIGADLAEVAPIPGAKASVDAPASAATTEQRLDAAYNDYLRHGVSNGVQAMSGFGRMSAENRSVLLGSGLETRDQGVGTGGAGGFLVPQGFLVKLTERLKYFGPMRDVANKIQTASGNDMPWPHEDDTANSGAILSENTSVSELDVVLTSKTLKSWMYTSGLVKVSWQLLNDSAFDVESHLTKVLGTRLGRIQNTHFTTGNGTTQPEGILTNAIANSPVYTDDQSGTISLRYSALVNLVHTLDVAYRQQGPSFQMHDSTLGQVRLLVDGNSRPLWTPNYGAIAGGDPDNILGYPVKVNNDFTTYSSLADEGIAAGFGLWDQHYIVRDVLGVSMVRLDERYADQLQTGFFAYMRTDGRVDDPNAAAYLVLS